MDITTALGSNLVYQNRYAEATTVNSGVITASGMLPSAEQVNIASCGDGTSNTIIVGEASDWIRNQDPLISTKYHGDFGWTSGWLAGTSEFLAVGRGWGNQNGETWNLTTVRYPPGRKEVLTGPTAGLPGCSEVMGHNNPLQSAHPGGLLVGMTDASVQFMQDTIDIVVALRLSIRDDGQNIPEW